MEEQREEMADVPQKLPHHLPMTKLALAEATLLDT